MAFQLVYMVLSRSWWSNVAFMFDFYQYMSSYPAKRDQLLTSPTLLSDFKKNLIRISLVCISKNFNSFLPQECTYIQGIYDLHPLLTTDFPRQSFLSGLDGHIFPLRSCQGMTNSHFHLRQVITCTTL